MRFGGWTRFAVVVILTAGSVAWGQEAPLTRTTPPQWAGQAVPEGVARFKFAVISDRHGGRKPGSTVFADTIREVNLLDPDFVICVGDLVSGYTKDADAIKAQWEELDRDISRLKRPFYYVFGNHDASNPEMEEILRKRYGSPWYSFNHKNGHFIVLFTENRNAAGEVINEIGKEQLAWLKRDMAANPNAEQYFIFMHRPFADAPAWEAVESLFEGKKLTVIAGHDHAYRQTMRNGHDYLVLSTTGGEIDPKHFWAGEMYHSVLVSVTGSESTIAVIRSGAIIPHDLLNEKLLAELEALRTRAASLTYQVPRNALEVDDDLLIRLDNPLSTPMIGTLNWEILPNSPWKVEPLENSFVIEPGQTGEIKVHLKYPADPFGPNPADPPGYNLVLRSGRREDSHTPYEGGRDEVLNVRSPLKVDRWPYTATVQTLRKGMTLNPVKAGLRAGRVRRPLELTNVLDTPMTVGLKWTNGNPGWSVEPETSQLLLPAHQKATVDFDFDCTAIGIDALPVPSLTLQATSEGQEVLNETRLLAVDLREALAGYCPVAKVPPLTTDLKIDGVMDEETWGEAAALGRFVDMGGMGQAPLETEVRVGRGRTGLYVAVVCQDPDMAHLAAKARDHDGAIWKDDLIELFIDSNLDHLTYCHLAINAIGTTYDAKNRDRKWEGQWLSAVTRDEKRWTVEIFIPWSDLGGPPPPGAQWGFNVARKRPGRLPEPVYTFWSPTLKPDSHVPDRFGVLVFP